MELSTQQIALFRETLAEYYSRSGRHDLPWRQPEPDGTFDPYKIIVSELMLQQTQVPRVIPKYHEFLNRFPTVASLAGSELGEVLRVWQGLGYNRRAKFLWQAAGMIGNRAAPPDRLEGLVALPGIGLNTAGAVLAYAFNRPAVFIETNVRTVYIHDFLADQTDIDDKRIQSLVSQTIDNENPRDFYWALMDYGSFLKSSVGNASKSSRHYVKQSKFQGSRRQLRGQVIRMLSNGPLTLTALQAGITDDRLEAVLEDLLQEHLIDQNGGLYRL